MLNSFRAKLTGTYLALIVLILLIAGIVGYYSFKKYYLDNLEKSLVREAKLAADMTQHLDPAIPADRAYQLICDLAARDSSARITIINREGVVLGDSAFERSKMDIHSNRPEVYQALHGRVGVAMRYSSTEKIQMLYVAVPFANQDLDGAVRIAMPLADLQGMNKNILTIVLLALLISGLAAFLLGIILAERFSQPLQDITAAVKEMAGGNLKKRLVYYSNDEIGTLADAFNDMGENLEKGINHISQIKNRLQALLDNTVNAILMVGASGQINFANPVARTLLGLSQEVEGKKPVEIIKNYELLHTLDQVQKNGQRKDLLLQLAEGKTVEASLIPIAGEESASQGVLVVLNDITELKRLEQVRKDFVANVSHELKTPIAAISGFAETLLQEEGENQENVMEFSRIIFDESQRLSRLIKSLTDLSKLEADYIELNYQEVDLKRLVENIIAVVQQRNGVTIEYHQNVNNPVIHSDPDWITQVLTNLLDNAVKFCPEEAPIEVSLKASENQIRISVTDHGPGIPEKDLNRIFERFYRVDKARSRKTGGTGLGLAISKHLAQGLGGGIEVLSEQGKGSTFIFYLPAPGN